MQPMQQSETMYDFSGQRSQPILITLTSGSVMTFTAAMAGAISSRMGAWAPNSFRSSPNASRTRSRTTARSLNTQSR
jgi:hypothetical protein